MRLLHAVLQQSQNAVGQHCHRKAQQRRAGVAQATDLAVEHRLRPLKHALNVPAHAIQHGDLPSAHSLGQVAPQPDRNLARFCRRIERELNAPPQLLQPRILNCLYGRPTTLGTAAPAQFPLPNRPEMPGVLVHDETGPCLVPGPHNQVRAEVTLSSPQLPQLRAVPHRRQVDGMRMLWPRCNLDQRYSDTGSSAT